MNQIVPLQAGGVPAIFASMPNLPDMAAAARAGISAGFAVVGYKGRNWRLKYAGDDELLKDERGVPFPTLEVVIVGISPNISKIWYEKKFTEGDDAAPDCWSVDGVTPDATAPKRQASQCALCPRAVWGSRITDSGKKGKECQDSRRLAVVPHGDIPNEGYGGPMLLRVPPMSLGNLGAYAKEIQRFGAQPFMVRTQLGFNYDVAYPEITFRALGWLEGDEAAQVLEQINNPLVDRILHDELPTASPAAPLQPAGADASALAGGPPAAFAGQQASAVQAGPDPAQQKAQQQAQQSQQQAALQAQIDAQRAELAAQQAALVEQQRALAAQQMAAAQQAQQQATNTPAAAPAATKKSPFGSKSSPGVAKPAVQPAALAAHERPAGLPGENFLNAPVAGAAQALDTPAATTTVVSPAPEDMEAAINALLD